MKDYQLRVVEELNQLNERFGKLDFFLCTPEFNRLSEEERELLRQQHSCMEEYRRILHERIEMFKRLCPSQSELAS